MVIGMAGVVGSGKSTVLSIMEQEYPVQICMADELGHAALEQGTEAYVAVVAAFGEEILRGDGRVDRNVLSDIVYRDGEKLSVLNGIIHPCVKKEIRRQIETGRTYYRHLIVVTNEVFSDGVIGADTVRSYVQALGTVNRHLATLADVFCEVVYTIPAFLKGESLCQF